MSTSIVTDQSKNITWNARRGDDQSIHIDIVDENGDTYDISEEVFKVELNRFSGGGVLTLEEGSGITNGGVAGTLDIVFTDSQLSISSDTYLVFLRSTNSLTTFIRTWLNGTFILNGDLWDGSATIEETITVNNGPINITMTITLAGGGGGGLSPVTDFAMTNALPTSPSDGDRYRIILTAPYTPVIIGNTAYNHKQLIEYVQVGDYWISYNNNTSDM